MKGVYSSKDPVRNQRALSAIFDRRLLEIIRNGKVTVKVKNADGGETFEEVSYLPPEMLETIRKRLVDIGRTDARAGKRNDSVMDALRSATAANQQDQDKKPDGRANNNPQRNIALAREGERLETESAANSQPQQHTVIVKIEQPGAQSPTPPPPSAALRANPELERLMNGAANVTPNGH